MLTLSFMPDQAAGVFNELTVETLSCQDLLATEWESTSDLNLSLSWQDPKR